MMKFLISATLTAVKPFPRRQPIYRLRELNGIRPYAYLTEREFRIFDDEIFDFRDLDRRQVVVRDGNRYTALRAGGKRRGVTLSEKESFDVRLVFHIRGEFISCRLRRFYFLGLGRSRIYDRVVIIDRAVSVRRAFGFCRREERRDRVVAHRVVGGLFLGEVVIEIARRHEQYHHRAQNDDFFLVCCHNSLYNSFSFFIFVFYFFNFGIFDSGVFDSGIFDSGILIPAF
jgi:hypothetical protein